MRRGERGSTKQGRAAANQFELACSLILVRKNKQYVLLYISTLLIMHHIVLLLLHLSHRCPLNHPKITFSPFLSIQ
jgi:hypothetical protein